MSSSNDLPWSHLFPEMKKQDYGTVPTNYGLKKTKLKTQKLLEISEKTFGDMKTKISTLEEKNKRLSKELILQPIRMCVVAAAVELKQSEQPVTSDNMVEEVKTYLQQLSEMKNWLGSKNKLKKDQDAVDMIFNIKRTDLDAIIKEVVNNLK